MLNGSLYCCSSTTVAHAVWAVRWLVVFLRDLNAVNISITTTPTFQITMTTSMAANEYTSQNTLKHIGKGKIKEPSYISINPRHSAGSVNKLCF